MRIALLLVATLMLAGCGVRGPLERAPPLFGDDRRLYEEERAAREAEEAAKAEAEAAEQRAREGAQPPA